MFGRIFPAFFLFTTAANAATYQFVYTGATLKPDGYTPVVGATKLTLTFTGKTPLPLNSCSYLENQGWKLTGFSDGLNTLSSFRKAGWLVEPGTGVCVGATETSVTLVQGELFLTAVSPIVPINGYLTYTIFYNTNVAQVYLDGGVELQFYFGIITTPGNPGEYGVSVNSNKPGTAFIKELP